LKKREGKKKGFETEVWFSDFDVFRVSDLERRGE